MLSILINAYACSPNMGSDNMWHGIGVLTWLNIVSCISLEKVNLRIR